MVRYLKFIPFGVTLFSKLWTLFLLIDAYTFIYIFDFLFHHWWEWCTFFQIIIHNKSMNEKCEILWKCFVISILFTLLLDSFTHTHTHILLFIITNWPKTVILTHLKKKLFVENLIYLAKFDHKLIAKMQHFLSLSFCLCVCMYACVFECLDV